MYLIASLASELIFPINYGIKSTQTQREMSFTGFRASRFRGAGASTNESGWCIIYVIQGLRGLLNA